MRTILPGCGRQATRRVEAFDGTTPVATLYTCDEHNEPAKTTFQASGFLAHSMPYRPPAGTGTPLLCGDGIDYTGVTILVWTAAEATVDGGR